MFFLILLPLILCLVPIVGMTPVITAAERTRDVVVLLFITFPGLLSLEDVSILCDELHPKLELN